MVAYGLTEHRTYRSTTIAERGPPSTPIATRPAKPTRLSASITEEAIARWRAALAADTELIARLARERGWLYATMLELELGFDRGRITIPVRDDERRLIGMLRYQPWPQPRRAQDARHRRLTPSVAAAPRRRTLHASAARRGRARHDRAHAHAACPPSPYPASTAGDPVGPNSSPAAKSRSSWTATSKDGRLRQRSPATSRASATCTCSTSLPTATTATT